MDGFAASGSNTAQGYTELEASSLAVGLPDGLMGNSEVGHLNIGAGRVVWQDVSHQPAAPIRPDFGLMPGGHELMYATDMYGSIGCVGGPNRPDPPQG